MKSFNELKQVFASPHYLMYLNSNRVRYINLDASKVWGFAAVIYHIKSDLQGASKRIISKGDASKPFTRTNIQPIMFLSKILNSAEINYWPTELEVAGLFGSSRRLGTWLKRASGRRSATFHTRHAPVDILTILNIPNNSICL